MKTTNSCRGGPAVRCRAGTSVGKSRLRESLMSTVRAEAAPLKETAAVKRDYGGYFFLDEAHSMGVLGDTGRGPAFGPRAPSSTFCASMAEVSGSRTVRGSPTRLIA